MSQDYYSQIQNSKLNLPLNDRRQVMVIPNGPSTPESRAGLRDSSRKMGAYLQEVKGTGKPIDIYCVVTNPKSKHLPQKIEITPYPLGQDTFVLHAHVTPPAKESKAASAN